MKHTDSPVVIEADSVSQKVVSGDVVYMFFLKRDKVAEFKDSIVGWSKILF